MNFEKANCELAEVESVVAERGMLVAKADTHRPRIGDKAAAGNRIGTGDQQYPDLDMRDTLEAVLGNPESPLLGTECAS